MVILGNEQVELMDNLLLNKRIGLITNPTGVNRKLESTIDRFIEAGYNITALYGPEHGIRGDVQAGEKVESSKDLSTGIPVYSLYGQNKKPSGSMLKDVDTLVFDIQDAGTRFYTYLYTMTLAMEAASENDKEFIVLDRPNPLGGNIVEGNILEDEFSSFVGMYPVPQRYGLTIGEFALWAKEKFIPDVNLKVIPMKGWSRDMLWEDTDLSWVMPSPNLPTFQSILSYMTMVVFEGTNVSEGRGTTKPFSIVGSPWIDAGLLAKEMNGKTPEDIIFRPVSFKPTFSKFQGEVCNGIEMHLIGNSRVAIGMVETGYRLLYTIKELWPEKFKFLKAAESDLQSVGNNKLFISLLTGSNGMISNKTLEELFGIMKIDQNKFQKEKRKFHLY